MIHKHLNHFIYGFLLIAGNCLPTTTSESKVIYFIGLEETSCLTNVQVLTSQPSRTMECAALCAQQNCKGFKYQGGHCVVSMNSNVLVSSSIKSYAFKKKPYEMSFENVALGKPTTTKDFWTRPRDMVGDLAVDGLEDNENYYHSHPDEGNPWWYVDLGQNLLIYLVEVNPNGKDHSALFKDVEVRVGTEPVADGDFSAWPLFGSYSGPPNAGDKVKFTTTVGEICGRYVSIKKTSQSPRKYFAFNEVKVFAYKEVIGQ